MNLKTNHLQGKVYDVTGNKAYQPGASYNGTLLPSFSHIHLLD